MWPRFFVGRAFSELGTVISLQMHISRKLGELQFAIWPFIGRDANCAEIRDPRFPFTRKTCIFREIAPCSSL